MSIEALKEVYGSFRLADPNKLVNNHMLEGLIKAILEPETEGLIGGYRLRQVDFVDGSTPNIIYLEHKDGALFRFMRQD